MLKVFFKGRVLATFMGDKTFLFRDKVRNISFYYTLLPVQLFPSPEKPTLQEQMYDPTVFSQLAFASQTEGEDMHSSSSI